LGKTAQSVGWALRDTLAATDEDTGKRQWGLPSNLKLFGPKTLLNTNITNQRTFAGRTISLAETKFIGKTLGGTLNDVVMTTTAGALRRYLKDHNDLPDKSLLVAIPVSLREAGDTSANNQVSFVTSVLGTDISDPVRRLHVIHEASEANKRMMSRVKTAIPTDFPLLGAPWLMSGLAAVVSRSGLLGSMAPISNLIISNVPGSPVPLYFAGAQLASFYPVSIVVHSMALNVTVQSYAGRLDYGLIACRRALPDVTDLGDYLLAEHELLLAKAKEAASVMAPIADQRSSAAPQQAVSRGASAERKASAPRRAKAAPAKAAKAAAPTR
jgi:diacylglycerol O-acyltransferase / wax synthase